MDKALLEHLLSSYNWWMEASTIAVAVGILGEYVAHFVFEREARRNRLEMTVSILCGVIVLSGVVGEWVVGSRLSQVSERLQLIADTEVAQSNRDAAAARVEAETARKDAASLKLDIAIANERVSTANKETARLNKAAEEERLSRLKIEEKLADRKLTDSQATVIAEKLKTFVGQQIEIVAYWESKESMAIANRVLYALRLAGWEYLPPKQGTAMLGGVTGVLVYVHPEAAPHPREAAKSLVAALNEQGIVSEMRYQNDPGHPNNKLSIEVGSKP